MTVVPDGDLMTLICDACGDTATGTASALPDAEVVWTLVAEHGWTGSAFATGPQHCPRCSLLPPGPVGGEGQPGDGAVRRAVHGPGAAFEVAHRPGFTLVTVSADIDEASTGPLRTALAEAVGPGNDVVVDLSRVDVIHATGLGLLVRAHQEARERGVVLYLAAPSRFVRTVLHTMRLDGVFPLLDDPDDVPGAGRATTAGPVTVPRVGGLASRI